MLANPNIAVGKRLNISDLSAPRELSRRERYVPSRFLNKHVLIHADSEEKEKKDAKERYWKVRRPQ